MPGDNSYHCSANGITAVCGVDIMHAVTLTGKPHSFDRKRDFPRNLPDHACDACLYVINGVPRCSKCNASADLGENGLCRDCSVSSGVGHKSDAGKARFDLIPPVAEKLLAEVLTFGAKKYAPENWRNMEDWRGRYMAAARRHMNAWKRGERLDKETGMPHLAHALCCLAFMAELDEKEASGGNTPS